MTEFPRKDRILADLAIWVSGDVSEIPEALDMTIISMCTQFINTHELLTPIEDRNNGVTSLSEGDVSVSFKTPADVYTTIQSANPITDNFLAQLNSFRRVQR